MQGHDRYSITYMNLAVHPGVMYKRHDKTTIRLFTEACSDRGTTTWWSENEKQPGVLDGFKKKYNH